MELSKSVISKEKQKLKTAIAILVFGMIAMLIIFSGRIANAIDERNISYLYWNGFYYIPMQNEYVPEDYLEPVGTVRKAGIKNDDNYGGDSNIADPGSEIYMIVPPEGADPEEFRDCDTTLVAKIDGRLTLFRFAFWGRQDYEKFMGYNIKEGEWGKGFIKVDDIY